MVKPMGLNINVFAKSALAILAVVVLITFLGGIGSDSQEMMDLGMTLFGWVIFAIIAVTIIINLPRYMKR